MKITYCINAAITTDQIIELYKSADLPRPINDKERIQIMFEHSNLVISAWDQDLLVGVSRSITDWVWSCYLADLAVKQEYMKKGIGRELIRLTKEKVGRQCMVLLLSVPTAIEYYPKIGFVKQESSFILNRDE